MRVGKSILFNLCFAANCLLVFLLITEDFLVLPAWLQVAGRMHPLLLHFPLVLVLLAVIWETTISFKWFNTTGAYIIGDTILLLAALTSVTTALMGFFLSREPGYDATEIALHKWSGVGLALFTLLWYLFRVPLRQQRWRVATVSLFSLLVLLVAGHEGGIITHGENFLTAPIASDDEIEMVPFEKAKLFDHVIQPILVEKCLGCHNPSKAKGELILDNITSILKGGKSGALWDSTAADLGLLLQRVHLPLDNKKHMPPKAKPQLTPEETAILYYWIKAGADTSTKLADLPETDSLRILTAGKFNNSGPELYTFAPADAALIDKLNSHYRLVAPVAANSPALDVTFFGANQYNNAALKELQPIAPQMVSLHLDNMPVTDADIPIITGFSNLRQLHLSGSKITDAALSAIKTLPQLKQLSLSGTAVTYTGLKNLAGAPALRKVYCWNISGNNADFETLTKAQPAIKWENGFNADTVLLTLSAPVIETDKLVFQDSMSVSMKHYIKGAALRYTLDGSEPDSSASALYEKPVLLQQSTNLKLRAFKKGWLGSSTVSRQFYLKGLLPDSSWYKSLPDSLYQKRGVGRLFDGEKGNTVFSATPWTGFRKSPMLLAMSFKQPTTLHQVAVSVLDDNNSYLFPPQQMEVWGADKGPMKLLAKLTPTQPGKIVPADIRLYELNFKPTVLTRIELKVVNVQRIPNWHPGKGQKGWFFTDEVFLH